MARLPPQPQADEPFQIFEDDFFPEISNAPMPSQPNPARPPLQNQNANAILCPPTTNAPLKQSSPFKSSAPPHSSPLGTLNASQNSRLNMVPMMPPTMVPPGVAPPSTDSLEKKQPVMSRFKTAAKKPHPNSGIQFVPKDIAAQLPQYPEPAQSQFDLDLGSFYRNDCGKRVLMEAAPIKELRPSKKHRIKGPVSDDYDYESFAPIVDDGQKPNHSYATLIAMAIVRSPRRRLTLSQIYKWISDTYSYYRGDAMGWQNSIRHNLSLNKSFVKQERPKDDPGKGSYWAIEPGTEHTVLKEKPSRKPAAPTAENMPVMSTRLEPSQLQPQQPQQQQPQQQPQLQPQPHPQQRQQQQQQQQQLAQQQQQQKQHLIQLQQHAQLNCQLQHAQLLQQAPCMPDAMLPGHLGIPQSILPALPVSSSLQPQQNLAPAPSVMPMISSDATIPASDAATIEDLEPQGYSPLPAAMHSSPPIPRRMEGLHHGTPPQPSYQQLRQQQSSAIKPRHRERFQPAVDSGYISSVDSSARRPNQHTKLLTSEADRPRIKKGRAEEEIARIRSSSYDSPSKGRSYGYPPASSSPLRQSDNGPGQMLPPLTPATKLKAPPKPPPSVSPSTNLRLHRENMRNLVDSPYRRLGALMPETGDLSLQRTPGLQAESLWYMFADQSTPTSNTPTSNTPTFHIHEDPTDLQALFSTTPTLGTSATHLGSPTKRSSLSSRRQRSHSTSAALGLLPASATNSAQKPNFLRAQSHNTGFELDTPSKVFEGLPPSSPSKAFEDLIQESPSKMPASANNENLVGFPIARIEFDDSGYGVVDMLAGFQKIGGGNQQQPLGAQGSYGLPPSAGNY